MNSKIVVISAKFLIEAILFFGVLKQLYVLFSSATRWESRIHDISRLRYHLTDELKALKRLESYCLEKKDGETLNNVRVLTLITES